MGEVSEQLMEALSVLEEVAVDLTPEDAVETLDETTLQVFWRDWPHVSSWAGALWRRLNQDLAASASPEGSSDVETGGGD